MANKFMKRCSHHNIREMQMETTVEDHLSEVRMDIIKNLQQVFSGGSMIKNRPARLLSLGWEDSTCRGAPLLKLICPRACALQQEKPPQ